MNIRNRKYCCICAADMKSHKNYAAPLIESWCCDECNANYVIPARFASYYSHKDRDSRDSK